MNTPNRKIRRETLRALPRVGDELTGFRELDARGARMLPRMTRIFSGAQIWAQLYHASSDLGLVEFQLAVGRHDKGRLHTHWQTLMRVKEFVCPGRAAFEAFPSAPELVTDDAPMWHLWVLREELKLGVSLGGRAT